MQLRKLYRTIEAIASQEFNTQEDLLKHVVNQIACSDEIAIKGGRIWKFDPKLAAYELIYQTGEIESIKRKYHVKLKDYPIFLELPKVRTILASEQDQYLRLRGILRYSATGIGETVIWRGKEVFRYVLAFNADHLNENLSATLNIISAALSSVLRSKRIEEKSRALKQDLDKAREIQRSILPQHEMRFHGYDIYGVSLPDRIVGGDFFDYLQVDGDSERFGFVIGDAASKGVSAAVQALYVSGALRMGFEYHTKISWLLSRVNKLVHRTFAEEKFVSLVYGELHDDPTGLVLYANCGHNSPIHFSAAAGSTTLLETTGQLLGPFPNEKFRTANFHMFTGDIMLLYTDGVTEARNEQGEFFGEERLAARLVELHACTAKDITQQILEDVQKFSALSELSDDKTIVTIKRNR